MKFGNSQLKCYRQRTGRGGGVGDSCLSHTNIKRGKRERKREREREVEKDRGRDVGKIKKKIKREKNSGILTERE